LSLNFLKRNWSGRRSDEICKAFEREFLSVW
jgi:hypothetical protein